MRRISLHKQSTVNSHWSLNEIEREKKTKRTGNVLDCLSNPPHDERR